MKKLGYQMAFTFAILLLVSNIFGQGVPAPYTVRLQPFMSGLDRPILFRDDGLGNGRKKFVVQQTGLIRLLQPGSRVPTDFINLSSRIPVLGGLGDERGLLGMTVHPQFEANGKFYVNYTRASDGATVIAEYTTVSGNPNQGDFNSERILLVIPQPFGNHNGGMIEFGVTMSDYTYLYIGMGDGGSGNDPGNRAQNRALLLGKMLRIDPNVPAGSPVPYLIPPGNPFQGANTTRCDGGSTTTGNTCQEIWAIGMRNPWRWSFDKNSGNLWVGDVGQFSVEEVDLIQQGANYGWRVYEGTSCTNLDPSLCVPANYSPPVFEYSSASGPRCSITGGYFYRGAQRSLPANSYIFSDYCSAEIMRWGGSLPIQVLQDAPGNIISFGQDENNELYACFGASVSRITRAKASADFDGDLRTDIAIYRPSTGTWYVLNSSNLTVRIQNFGIDGDIPSIEDFDGDNISDIGVFRPSTGRGYYYKSGDGFVSSYQFAIGDIPAAADYDGDGIGDPAVFTPATGIWRVLSSRYAIVFDRSFGLDGDVPVPGDYDGDGIADFAVWRPSTGVWYSINSDGGEWQQRPFGLNGDIPSQGDYDNDGKTDIAVFRPSTGTWYILRSLTGTVQFTRWGTDGDVPAVGDHDGDGLDDLAVYRPTNGTWYRLNSSNGAVSISNWGLAEDLAAPKYDAP